MKFSARGRMTFHCRWMVPRPVWRWAAGRPYTRLQTHSVECRSRLPVVFRDNAWMFRGVP
jgi:hypothetical protein